MGKIDLHIHSSASDGYFSPEEIVRRAAELGLSVISIADHDSTNGVAPALSAARAFPQLRVIPNVEISTDTPGGEVHVLGYFIDYTSEELQSNLKKFRDSREIRARRMIARLKECNIQISWQRVQEIAGSGSIGRPHIAQAMLENGYIDSIREAFDKYIGHGGPAYVEREKITPLQAVALILRAQGLPALAHPLSAEDPEAMIASLKAAGLVAIEAYYNGYTTDQVESLVRLAAKYQLIASGGSDYHGFEDGNKAMIGCIDIPEEAVEHLTALAEQRTAKASQHTITRDL